MKSERALRKETTTRQVSVYYSLNICLYLHLLRDEAIQPASVDTIVLEAFSLQQLDEVFYGGSKVSSDGQLLKSHNHVAKDEKWQLVSYQYL